MEFACTRRNAFWGLDRSMAVVGRDRMAIIGTLEVLGAIGLILPSALHILPWLTPAAAFLLAALMAFGVLSNG